MKIVDSTKEKGHDKPPIWLIWSVSTAGLTSLRAICTTAYMAKQYRKYVDQCGGKKLVRVWIEKTVANHLFMEGEIEQNYASIGKWDHIVNKRKGE